MITRYRIKYHIVEDGTTYSGIKVVEEPIAEHIVIVRKQFPDASLVYLELIEEFEQDDHSESATGVIIMGYVTVIGEWVVP